MSQQTSPSTHRPYGVTRVLHVWELPRSTFYAQRERRTSPATARRGRPPQIDDVPLLVHILTPGQKPWQMTKDLKGFWAGGYAQMKKLTHLSILFWNL